MNGYAGNTFRAVQADGSWNYIKCVYSDLIVERFTKSQTTVRIIAKTDQGIKNRTQDESVRIAGENPDFGVTDMWDAIESGDFPSWTVYFQAMNASQAEKFKCKFPI